MIHSYSKELKNVFQKLLYKNSLKDVYKASPKFKIHMKWFPFSFLFLKSLFSMVLTKKVIAKSNCPPKKLEMFIANNRYYFSHMKCFNCHMTLMHRENSIVVVFICLFTYLFLFWSASSVSSELIWNFLSQNCAKEMFLLLIYF